MEVWKPEKTEEFFSQWNLLVVLFQFVHNISLVILFQNLSLVHSNFGGLWGYKIFSFIFFLNVDSPRTQKLVIFLTYNADQTQKSNIEKALLSSIWVETQNLPRFSVISIGEVLIPFFECWSYGSKG